MLLCFSNHSLLYQERPHKIYGIQNFINLNTALVYTRACYVSPLNVPMPCFVQFVYATHYLYGH